MGNTETDFCKFEGDQEMEQGVRKRQGRGSGKNWCVMYVDQLPIMKVPQISSN